MGGRLAIIRLAFARLVEASERCTIRELTPKSKQREEQEQSKKESKDRGRQWSKIEIGEQVRWTSCIR